MSTPDGISTEEWNHVEDLAAALVRAPKGAAKSESLLRLLTYLSELQKKYGPLPSILATRADFIDNPPAQEELLQRAYSAALARQDWVNVIDAADSLADLYLESHDGSQQGREWVAQASEDLRELPLERLRDDWQSLHEKLQRLKNPPTGSPS